LKVEWLPVALADRDSQVRYIAQHNVPAAIRVGDAIMSAAVSLGDFPGAFREGRVSGTRERAVAGTPLVLVYRVEPDAVLILRVLHGAQRWPPEPS
jgi:toxin ParE1/3/4